MKVSVKNLSGCAREVQVEVPAEDVRIKVEDIYQKISREAKLSGFRKGKAPLDVIRKQYKSTVREEMVRNELPDYFRTVLVEQKIDPVAQPQITHLEFEEGTPLKFTGVVEVKPVFDLKDYKSLPIKKSSTEVDDAELGKALDGMRDQLAQFIVVEDRPAKSDDLVVIDFEGKVDGKPFEGGKATHYAVLLGSQGLLKDFEENLIGLRKSETKAFKVTFPADYGKKDISGKEAEFTVTLQEIKEKKLPALDDQFAQDIAKIPTLAELREKLRAQIMSNKELEQRSRMVEQIAERLIGDHPFDVPTSLVAMEQQRLVQQGVERLRGQGVDIAKLTEEQKKDFVENLRPVAQKNVQMALIVEKITEAESIVCGEGDMEAYFERVAKNANQPVDTVKRYIQQQGNTGSVKEWIQYEKTIDFLISAAKIEAA